MNNIEQLIHDLRCCKNEDCSRCGMNEKLCYSTLYEQAITALEQLRKENAKIREQMRWRDAKIELPEKETPVFVRYLGYNDGKPYCEAIANIRYGDWCWYEDVTSDNDVVCCVAITHWMPLPEPPEKVQPSGADPSHSLRVTQDAQDDTEKTEGE